MNYVYKDKPVLEYLKEIGIKSDKERMKIIREIIFLKFKKDISFEGSVDLYLKTKSESKEIKKVKRETSIIIYKGVNLKKYLIDNYGSDLPHSMDIEMCYKSIKNYLNKNNGNNNTEKLIDSYFENYYYKYLKTHNFNKLNYMGISVNDIIKRIVGKDNKDKVNHIKNKIYKLYNLLKKAHINDEEALYYSLSYYFSKNEIDSFCFGRKLK